MKIEQLTKEHSCHAFDCGAPSLNNFLHRTALKKQKKNLSVTYVGVRENDNVILGYYTLTAGSIEGANIVPTVQDRFPIPTTVLACFATHREHQGQGVGKILLRDALTRACQAKGLVGSYAVVLDAIDEKAKSFYLKHGFTELQDNSFHLFLPMSEIENEILRLK